MTKGLRKVLLIGLGLLLLTGIKMGSNDINVHAMPTPPDANTAGTEAALRSDMYKSNEQAQQARTAANWANFKAWENEPHETYSQIIESHEESLSKVYPHGHWNGKSDFKGDNTNYKKLEKQHKKMFKHYYNQLKSKNIAQINSEKRKFARQKHIDITKLNALVDKINKQEKANQRYTRHWYRTHTYKNHSNVKYLPYKNNNQGFSKHQWRYAFPVGSNGITKIGLTRSYKVIMKSAKGPDNPVIKYKSDAIVKPGQLVQMKLIKRVGKYSYVYRAKFKGRYYYYTNDCDKWESEITPFTADYYKGDYQSVFKPWTYKTLYLNRSHKLHNGSEWDYNPGTDNDTYYKLRNGHWHETDYSYTSPVNLNE